MIDVDLISHLDVRTGLPVIDHRSPAQRWLGAMHHGPEQHGTAHLHLTPPPPFGQVGAGETTNETAAPTAAKKKNTKCIM
jgi:hypothetical protein